MYSHCQIKTVWVVVVNPKIARDKLSGFDISYLPTLPTKNLHEKADTCGSNLKHSLKTQQLIASSESLQRAALASR